MNLRPATPTDLPLVAELLARVAPGGADVEQIERRLGLVLFEHPWRDPELPSWLAEDDTGKVQAFLGVVPRPMLFGDRPVRAAAAVRLAVRPECRAFVGTRLLRRFLEGPQELSLMDGGHCATRSVWERMGGSAALVYGLSWTRPLRPAAWVMTHLAPRLGPVVRGGRPLAWLVDGVLARAPLSHFRLPVPADRGRVVDEDDLIASMEQVAGRCLRARYEAADLRWLLARSEERVRAPLTRVAVHDSRGGVRGWYVMAAPPGQVAQVVQTGSRVGLADDVVCDMIDRAARQRCVALVGRVDPRFLQDLTDRGAILHASGLQSLIHARDATLARHIERGDALLGRLDGDWWTAL